MKHRVDDIMDWVIFRGSKSVNALATILGCEVKPRVVVGNGGEDCRVYWMVDFQGDEEIVVEGATYCKTRGGRVVVCRPDIG